MTSLGLAILLITSTFVVVVLSEPLPTSVLVLFRHGDRVPVDPYPLDPWRDPSHWPVPFGELTDRGKLQHYELGKKLREKYQHLLESDFNPKSLYVRSTDLDRTLMSAEANLAGMFPPNKSQSPIPGVWWQPIPVHTVPTSEDYILMKSDCPKFDDEQEKFFESPFYQMLDKQFEELYRYVSNNTGKYINDLTNLSYIYDTLYIEDLYNFTLPEWTKVVYPKQLKSVSKISFMLDTFTPTLSRLKVGPLLKEITEHMIACVNSDTYYKMKMYSAHDTTIANLMNALGLISYELPPYAATLIFEIYSEESPPSVRILYQMEELNIPKCGVMCPVYQFVTNYATLISENAAEECRLELIEPPSSSISLYVIYSLGAIVILLLIIIFITFIRHFKSSPTNI